jgi:hypothetical protein
MPSKYRYELLWVKRAAGGLQITTQWRALVMNVGVAGAKWAGMLQSY